MQKVEYKKNQSVNGGVQKELVCRRWCTKRVSMQKVVYKKGKYVEGGVQKE